ncbi:hypothetical protein MTR67_008177 [Solanum verrucosum]|jgi:hypothetical protein
MVKS